MKVAKCRTNAVKQWTAKEGLYPAILVLLITELKCCVIGNKYQTSMLGKCPSLIVFLVIIEIPEWIIYGSV